MTTQQERTCSFKLCVALVLHKNVIVYCNTVELVCLSVCLWSCRMSFTSDTPPLAIPSRAVMWHSQHTRFLSPPLLHTSAKLTPYVVDNVFLHVAYPLISLYVRTPSSQAKFCRQMANCCRSAVIEEWMNSEKNSSRSQCLGVGIIWCVHHVHPGVLSFIQRAEDNGCQNQCCNSSLTVSVHVFCSWFFLALYPTIPLL